MNKFTAGISQLAILGVLACGISLTTVQSAEAAPKACKASDQMGNVMRGREAGAWTFVFKRSGCSNSWSGEWYNPNEWIYSRPNKLTGSVKIYQNGNQITIHRPSVGGVSCTYKGNISRRYDEINTFVSGSYTCSNNYTGPWNANIR